MAACNKSLYKECIGSFVVIKFTSLNIDANLLFIAENIRLFASADAGRSQCENKTNGSGQRSTTPMNPVFRSRADVSKDHHQICKQYC